MKTLQEFLIDILRNSYIYEMAEKQSECENIVKSQLKNILENLTLINYFGISRLPTTNIRHWKNELIAAIFNAADFNVKKDRSEGRRIRIVKRVFDEKDMKDYDRIYNRIFQKFDKENETQQSNKNFNEWLDQAILATINQIDDIMDLIVKQNNQKIKEWVEKL